MPTFEQLLRVPHVDAGYGFDLSPDGSRIAFSWNKSGAWEIYEIPLFPLPGGVPGSGDDPRPVTASPGGKFHPRYSPDGSRLAYAIDLRGDEAYHIAVSDILSGQNSDLTPDITFAHQPNVSWSPDGRQLAVVSDAAGHFDLYSMQATSSEARLRLDVGHPCWDAQWSPDGEWIAVEVEWHGPDRSIFLVNIYSGEKRQLQENGATLNAMHPAWSPDGQTLAFCADPGGQYCIGLYHVNSDSIRWMQQTDGEDTDPAWSLGGRRLVCVHTRGADSSLRIYDLVDSTAARFRLASGIHSHPHFSHDGRNILFLFENPRHPNDLWRLDLATGTYTQLTRSLPEDLDTDAFIIPEEIWYPSIDGELVPAMLYRTGTQNAPALINIHGGPNWLYQCNWHPLMSYLAARGWTVLAPNYRGSTGYGRAWAHVNQMRLGEVDTFDCAAAAQYLIREKLADAAKITVSGRSHGGYLTMTCLTEYPDLWAGGSAIVPFLNWFTAHENSRRDLQHWDIENFGDPVENADLWRRRSPFFYLHQIRAGVQLVCGAQDPRCPASESLAARDRLNELGRPVELILYPDEGHGFLRLENIIDQEMRRLAFLERTVASVRA